MKKLLLTLMLGLITSFSWGVSAVTLYSTPGASSTTITAGYEALSGSITAQGWISAAGGVVCSAGNVTATALSLTNGIIAPGGVNCSAGNVTATAFNATAAGINVTYGNITITPTGSISLTNGSVSAPAGLVCSYGNISATAGAFVAGLYVTSPGGMSCTYGNLTLTAGNLITTAGNAQTAGGLIASYGNLTLTAGNISLTKGTISNHGESVTYANITITSGGYIVMPNGNAYFSCTGTTRDQVRLNAPGQTVPTGSIAISTAGKAYLKVANNNNTSDYQRVSTTASDQDNE